MPRAYGRLLFLQDGNCRGFLNSFIFQVTGNATWELLRFHSKLEKSSDEVEDVKDDRPIGPPTSDLTLTWTPHRFRIKAPIGNMSCNAAIVRDEYNRAPKTRITRC
jgi:hypothetical protein